MRLALLVSCVLAAFAGNSILCRAALDGGHADPAAFTLIRIACGAVTLYALARARGISPSVARHGAWVRGAALFLYAALFSMAYVKVPAGVGALVLFGAVQATMVLAAIRDGTGPRGRQAAGLAVALVGLAALTLPGTAAPDPMGLVLMAGSGIAWGFYSLLGRRATAPLAATATSFLAALPMAVLTALAAFAGHHLVCDARGAVLAAVSGAVTSGLGYALWTMVLPRLGTTRAGVVQLAVPVLAGLAGAVLLREPPSLRWIASSAAVLGGVGLATFTKAASPGAGPAMEGEARR